MRIYGKTDIGLKRQSNQDACFTGFLPDNSALAVVCDGMGGANAGNIASETAVKTISEYINKSYSNRLDSEGLLRLMANAVSSANSIIYEKSLSDKRCFGMGTTAVVLVVRNGFAFICHIGDSRAYLINEGINQITRDHSVVQSLVEDGKLTPEEAKNHPRRNIITKAVGAEQSVMPDCLKIPMEIGDTLLVCTDGLTNFIEETEILNIVKSNKCEDAVSVLIDTANKNGGGDNITAVTVTL